MDGNKVKFILNELDDRAADTQDQLLDLLEKMDKRDRDRFELDEGSKGEDDMI